jgi:signal transduction histidine kinase
MYKMFGVKFEEKIPSYDQLMNCINSEDRNVLSVLLDKAFNSGENYEFEAKVKTFAGEERWCFFAGNPHVIKGLPIRYISGIGMDITSRKLAEFELHKLNQQLISSARRAGMSEVATSILHNIGNILNSVNVSVGLIKKSIDDIDILSLYSVMDMFIENIHDLKNYLQNDPKGKLLPEFIIESKPYMQKQFTTIASEIQRLNDNVTHIKNIVAMQNTLSGASGVMEEINVASVIESAIEINASTLNKNEIFLDKEFLDSLVLISDKNKVMQILVNLIQNAKDAIIYSDTQNKKKIIKIKMKIINDTLEITIEDNGTGIAFENLTKIFSFGFTTKQKGHGFGLHSSALLAKELGGSLHAESDGLGLGARFILALPLVTTNERSAVDA